MFRSEHHAGGMRKTRQGGRCSGERILDRLVADDLPLDLAPLARVGRSRLHDPVDEKAKPALGRNPPRGGVRVREEPPLLQLLHHTADRRRR